MMPKSEYQFWKQSCSDDDSKIKSFDPLRGRGSTFRVSSESDNSEGKRHIKRANAASESAAKLRRWLFV
jgi:hypothetical protein